MMLIPLQGEKAAGRSAMIDSVYYPLVIQHGWHVVERVEDGRVTAGPYAATTLRGSGKTLYLHTLITGWPEVDHRDHNGLNCQMSNLREVTRPLNSANRRPGPGHTSRYKGVSWTPRSRPWKAEIRTDGKAIYLGLFMSEEAAARAYDRAALAIWGEFACLNLPDDQETPALTLF